MTTHAGEIRRGHLLLLSALGQPSVRLERLQRWQQQSSREDFEQLWIAQRKTNISLEPNDWVVELSTPVLEYLQAVKDCTLVVVETEHRRNPENAASVTRNRQLNPKARLEPIRLQNNRLLFVYPALHENRSEYDLNGYRHRSTYSLKVFIQLTLWKAVETKPYFFSDYDRIILPQPLPRKWQKFDPELIPNVDADENPYWLIAQRAFSQ